jgi:hypothetical protein
MKNAKNQWEPHQLRQYWTLWELMLFLEGRACAVQDFTDNSYNIPSKSKTVKIILGKNVNLRNRNPD